MILFIKENSSLHNVIKKEKGLPEAANKSDWWKKYAKKGDYDIDFEYRNKKGFFKFDTENNCLA